MKDFRMDPNQALKELREALKELNTPDTSQFSEANEALTHAKIVASIEGLDEWLTSGGALPEDWSSNRDEEYLFNEDLENLLKSNRLLNEKAKL